MRSLLPLEMSRRRSKPIFAIDDNAMSSTTHLTARSSPPASPRTVPTPLTIPRINALHAEMKELGPPPTPRSKPLPPVRPKHRLTDPIQGTHLRKYHLQTYMIIFWIIGLCGYIAAIERAIRAQSMDSFERKPDDEMDAFGIRGSKRRAFTVQAFSVARTVLTVIHVPVITAALSSLLPHWTQRQPGKNAPKLTADQLFHLADRSWATAGGWLVAIRYGHLCLQWWRLAALMAVTFAGFPVLTLAYTTGSSNFWSMYTYIGPSSLGFNDTLSQMLTPITNEIDVWMHRYPQRELGLTQVTVSRTGDFAPGTNGQYYTFHPPADPSQDYLGHFVTFIQPTDSEQRLIVANSRGVLENLTCQSLKPGDTPELIDMTAENWECKEPCTSEMISNNLCHNQRTLGQQNGTQMSQVISCGRQITNLSQVSDSIVFNRAVAATVELAFKINPDYSNVSASLFPQPTNAFSFHAGNQMSDKDYYVDVLRCNAYLIGGDGIVDSLAKEMMHFMPYGLGLARETSALLDDLKTSLPMMLNLTLTPPLTLLHKYFSTSLYGATPQGGVNNSLPTFFGVHKPSSDEDRTQHVFNYASTALTMPQTKDTFVIDDMIRVNPSIFLNAYTAAANSSLITALPYFVANTKQAGFSYQTDVKLERGLPIAIAPIVLLSPVLVVAWLLYKRWGAATWTEFLDSFAMFRLGRAWENELDGTGAQQLKDCYQARMIPGFVGDAEAPKLREIVEEQGKEYVGTVKLGGLADLKPNVRYS